MIPRNEVINKIQNYQTNQLFSLTEDIKCFRQKDLRFNRYLGEAFVYEDYKGENRVIVTSPTNTGKTTTVLSQLLEKESNVLIACSELLPAMQLSQIYNLPLHYAGNKLSPDTPKLVTVYNHVSDFHPKGRSKHVLVLDESHSLITDQAFREDVINKMVRSLSFFKHVICLTGTHLDSKFFYNYLLLECKPNLKPIEASLVKYQNDIAAVTKMTAYYVLKEGKKVMIYLQDTSTKLPKLTQALYESGITSISLLNSNTLNSFDNGQSIVESEEFTTEVLITTYRQSYNLKMKDVVFICFPDTDVVSIAQAIVRVRDPLYKAYILSNAEEDNLDFDTTYQALYNTYEEQAWDLLTTTQTEKWNNDQISAYLETEDNGGLIQYNQEINHLTVGYYAYRDLTQYMRFDRKLLVTGLGKYNVKIIKEYYDTNPKLDTKALKTDVDDYIEQITEILNAIQNKSSIKGLNSKLVSKVYDLLKIEADFESIREYFMNEYRPGCKNFNTKKFEIVFKKATGKAAVLKSLLLERIDTAKVYSLEELKSEVQNAAKISGYKVTEGKEIVIIDCLFARNRTSITQDDTVNYVYKLCNGSI